MNADPILIFLALVYALMTTLLTLGTTVLVLLVMVDLCAEQWARIKSRRAAPEAAEEVQP